MFRFVCTAIVIFFVESFAFAQAPMAPVSSHKHSSNILIQKYFRNITGLSLREREADDLRRECTEADGQLNETKLFEKLFSQPSFVENRLATLVSRLSNESGDPFEDGDDYQTALLLSLVANQDFRDIFTKKFSISTPSLGQLNETPSNGKFEVGQSVPSYTSLVEKYRLLFDKLSSGDPRLGMYQEGLFTTIGFGQRFLDGGTNRKAIRGIFDIFLCRPIDSWKDASLESFFVGRDVDHKPGGDPNAYNEKCRACHAPMDAMRGAFAHYDYAPVALNSAKNPLVREKYRTNSDVYPQGYETLDDSWEILLNTPEHQAVFGWRGSLKGQGVLSFASAIVNSKQFQSCMTKRFLANFCDLGESELNTVMATSEFRQLADGFEKSGYAPKTLIQQIVKSKLCR